MSIQELFRASNNLGMIGETQIVVGTKVDLSGDLAILGSHMDSRVLRGDDDAFRFVSAGSLDRVNLGPEDLSELTLSLGGHGSGSEGRRG